MDGAADHMENRGAVGVTEAHLGDLIDIQQANRAGPRRDLDEPSDRQLCRVFSHKFAIYLNILGVLKLLPTDMAFRRTGRDPFATVTLFGTLLAGAPPSR
jgi:hypothetical protein